MRTLFLILFLSLPFICSASTLPDTVVVLSIDALHPSALGKATAPVIHSLMKPGSYTLKGHSTTPPKTLVAHSAMLTGITPQQGGRLNNDWKEGEPVLQGATIFTSAKKNGYRTLFIYSKKKLGFLASHDIDVAKFSKEFPVTEAVKQLKNAEGRQLLFVHAGGLDIEGPKYGWLSPEYLETLTDIDSDISPLLDTLKARGSYLLIITSDHGGHEKLHGCEHPDDYIFPLVVTGSNPPAVSADEVYHVESLPRLLERAGVLKP